MLFKSWGVARATIRDFLHGSLSYRRRGKQCWRQSVDEWGNITGRQAQESSKQETSDDTFFTSCSMQSDTSDLSLTPGDNAIIKHGPQRSVNVQNRQTVQTVPASYLEIESQGTSQQGNHLNSSPPTSYGPSRHATDEENRLKSSSPQHLNLNPPLALDQASVPQTCNYTHRRRSRDWKFTNSILFAYNAMCGCNAEHTPLYTWLKRHHNHCRPESDCVLLLRKLEAQDFDVPDDEETAPFFSICRPSYEAMNWGDLPEWGGSDLANSSSVRYFTPDILSDVYDKAIREDGRISPNTYRLLTTGCSENPQPPDLLHGHTPFDTADEIDLTDDSASSISTGKSPTWTPHLLTKPDKHHRVLTWQDKLPNIPSSPSLSNKDTLTQSPPTITHLIRTKACLQIRLSILHATLDSITRHAGRILRRRVQTHESADDRYDEAWKGEYEQEQRLSGEVEKMRVWEDELKGWIEKVGEVVGVGWEEVNGDVGEMERLVRLIDEGEMEMEMQKTKTDMDCDGVRMEC